MAVDLEISIRLNMLKNCGSRAKLLLYEFRAIFRDKLFGGRGPAPTVPAA